ncbi:MAG TPA: prolipoprotein diacylglyceryl transferase family protein [Ktedonobacterales bacterium]|nr:prolipoprotein diacylglyceryl transferase family protein [Ktedonobacterales bacterium]
MTIRFTGRRVDVEGRLQPQDEFVHDEVIEEVVPGSGPMSVTVQIRNINPGEWTVTARELGPSLAASSASRSSRRWAQKQAAQVTPVEVSQRTIARFWRRWAPAVGSTESANHVHTSLLLFARAPGIIPGIWLLLVVLGMGLTLAVQSWVIVRDDLTIGPALPATLIAIAVGIVGAKVWYLILYRHESGLKRWNGWCIQGFITGATVMAAIMFTVWRVPAGIFLDVTAPGLMYGMAIGRVGCFFAGCCGGRLTASRWGVWSCDRHIGGRRVPTQLMESALALNLGIVALLAVLSHGPASGAIFVAALAAYTLGRQGILYLRAEPRKTRLGLPVTAALAALVLLAAIIFFIAQ